MKEKVLKATKSLIKIKLTLSILIGLVLITGYSAMAGVNETGGRKIIVKKGDKVKIQYKASLTNGTVFKESKPGKPLKFTVGDGKMPHGLDQAVLGMELREEKTVTVGPKDAYGKRNHELVMKFVKKDLPRSFEPEVGNVVKIRNVPGTIIKIDEENIYLDGNHPLAGKDVVFEIKVVGIE
ncbi:FKBP-type peptidyl-prolyl cis-trans isomerases 2 [Candidatus Scalindua japonica]|uniref:Peptidyl-prolyl cis-trans isomerase n=1 Tax=Candidatus Scalindua japonica TaxID=1284222 RepID=A0A286TYP2_9BACT|nr:peptidylprolyl isomerase [Candidatus Scalindua japonica]GAX60941.1 FKBP-type peptidyl-prolyl cis-trans isomerases 2 [Candidatus Scalindua japonica]